MSVIAELRRRNVFRVGAAYAVVAWLLIEISDTVFPRLGLPEWTVTFVIALLLLGLPVALFMAWAFELTPDGVKRATPASEAERAEAKSRWIDHAILVGLVVVAVSLVWQQLDTRRPDSAGETVKMPDAPDAPGASPAEAASIAVLPFADMSPAGDQEYFSDGITEEILNVLAGINGLEVASRTSAFQFKSRPATGVPQIARELNVRHILEGSVRKAGDTIRVTAQLIDTRSDRHLWSANYDRPLTAENVFGIQEDIASAIVAALQDTLELGEMEPVSVTVTTRNLDAYDLLLKARALFLERGIENMRESVRLLEHAVAADPTFAQAWGLLAVVNSALSSWVISGDEDFVMPARQAAERAIALDPGLGMPYAALGTVMQTEGDWAGSLQSLQTAIDIAPDNATAIFWRGLAWLRLGFFDAAESDLRTCLRLEPLYGNCHIHLSYLEMLRGNAAATVDYFLAGVARGVEGYKPKISYVLYQHGEKGAALRLVRQMYHWSPSFVDAWQRAVVGDSQARASAIDEWNRAAAEHMPELVDAPDILFEAQAYERISVTSNAYFRTHIAYAVWNPFYPGLRGGKEFKRLLRELAIEKYWRAYGFPPQCRPVGADDFECS